MNQDNIDITPQEQVAIEKALLKRNVTIPNHDEELQRIFSTTEHSGKSGGMDRKLILAIAGIAAAALLIFALSIKHENANTKSTENVALSAESKAHSAESTEQSAESGVHTTLISQENSTLKAQPSKLIKTPRKHSYHLELSDGTEVWLNAESQLYYPTEFTGAERRVKLVGEGFFKVKKDPTHPFIVENERLTTKVYGTTFNMRAFEREECRVTLLEGAVEVSKQAGEAVKLTPGQDVAIQKDGTFSVTTVDMENYSSWSDGHFYYDNTPIFDVLNDLSRWYGIDIKYLTKQDLTNMRIHFTASRNDHIATILDLLNSFTAVALTIEKGEIVVR